jgi:hypothetical protein
MPYHLVKWLQERVTQGESSKRQLGFHQISQRQQKLLPAPVRKFIGNLSQRESLLQALDIPIGQDGDEVGLGAGAGSLTGFPVGRRRGWRERGVFLEGG